MTQTTKQQQLYDRDFYLWIEDTVARLKARDFEQLDIENLIEEVETLGRSEKRELKNRLDVLLAHLLKRYYVEMPENYRGWVDTIDEQRRQVESLLEQSPSLKLYFAEVFDDCYAYALRKVRKDYPDLRFPDEWRFSREVNAVLSVDIWEI
jgi:hypothetical protein